jgi:hypothetical protein
MKLEHGDVALENEAKITSPNITITLTPT